MKNDYYTYAYLRKDGTPYYIGKGRRDRAFRKEGRAIKTPPKDRVLLLKTGLTEEEAFRHEIYMIALYGRKDKGTGILYNFTDGGEGGSGVIFTEERRRRMSEVHRGKKLSVEQIENLRRINTGRKMSESNKEKLRAALKGNKWNVGKKGELHACSKRVEVGYPDGTIEVFPSLQSAAETLDYNKSNLAKFVSRSVPPKSGKFKGYSFRYL